MIEHTLKHYCIGKYIPLTISRGTSYSGIHVFLEIKNQDKLGIGESVLVTGISDNEIQQFIMSVSNFLDQTDILNPIDLWQKGKNAGLSARAIALIDSAAWDILAKKANMPLYGLLGLASKPIKTSITVSIGEADWVYNRVKTILNKFNPYFLKIKLGASTGTESDKASFLAVKQAIMDSQKQNAIQVFVDANGGWNLAEAKYMLQWLKDKNAIYVEQPLAQGQEADLIHLYKDRPLPIYVDESIHFAHDIPKLINCVDGINLKLMKCGGITEALRIVHTARAYNLKCMIGCFSESSHSISAALSIGSLFDYVDLDSFLNLKEDKVIPQGNLKYEKGYLINSNKTGIGVIDGI